MRYPHEGQLARLEPPLNQRQACFQRSSRARRKQRDAGGSRRELRVGASDTTLESVARHLFFGACQLLVHAPLGSFTLIELPERQRHLQRAEEDITFGPRAGLRE